MELERAKELQGPRTLVSSRNFFRSTLRWLTVVSDSTGRADVTERGPA